MAQKRCHVGGRSRALEGAGEPVLEINVVDDVVPGAFGDHAKMAPYAVQVILAPSLRIERQNASSACRKREDDRALRL